MTSGGKVLDRVARVVECPGEEVVIGQELRILKPGEKYDISSDEDALSMRIVPGMEGDLKVAVSVCLDFEHKCCEQTAAAVAAACVSALIGNDSEKQKAYESIIKGAARLRSMFAKGKGFRSYPDRDIYADWSKATARRAAGFVIPDAATQDVLAAVKEMNEMGSDALKAHGNDALANEGKMESLYYGHSTANISNISDKDIESAIANLAQNTWDYRAKSEASFCAARLARSGRFEDAIYVANAVSKAMSAALGGAMHGSYEALAYMTMVYELQKAGVVPRAGSGKVKVNGKEMPLGKAVSVGEATSVEALETACAIRITRLNRIRFDEAKSGVEMSIDFRAKDGTKALKPGAKVKLTASVAGYKTGDVLCVALPDCLSRIVGGTKAKKFQIDFAGKDKIEIDLVAGRKTDRPQRWAAVVRNMYDGARIGSVGLLAAEVGEKA
jgi:hypothetical protein